MSKKLLSLFLAVVMVALAVPATVLSVFAAEVPEEVPGFTTTFSDAEDIVPENANRANYPTGTEFKFKDNWAIAGMSPSVWNDSYHVTNLSMNNGEGFYAGQWMEGTNGGGFYLASGQLVASVKYTGSGDARDFVELHSNILIRYTAPYFGTVSIDVTKLNFNNLWNAMFCILVNGEPVGQFDTEEFDYATGAGWLVPEDLDSTDVIDSIIDLDVNKGDKIDFVFRSTGADQNTEGIEFNYNNCKRLCNDWAFAVTYDAGYTPVKDMNAWDNEQSADVSYTSEATKYFFAWYDGGVKKGYGSALTANAVAKINPALVDAGIVKTTDTLADAWAKWVAHMKDTTKITYNSNWSMGDMTNGVYSPIVTFGYISGIGTFGLQGTAASNNYKVRGWDDQFWITEAGADKQYASAYKFVKDHSDLTDATLVSDIAVPVSDEVSNNTYGFPQKPTGSTSLSAVAGKGSGYNLENLFWQRPGNNKGTMNSAYTWTAPTAGYATFKVNSIQWQDNAPADVAVMLNGTVQIGYVTIDLSAADALDQINALLADFEAPVFKGDQVSLVFARVNGNAARVNLTAKANLDTSRIPPVYDEENKWTGDSASATVDINNTRGTYFFSWFDNDREVTSGNLSNNAICKINPYLIDNGIVDATDSVKVAFDKWVAYMKQTTKINYNTNWTLGSMTASGVYEPILYHGFLSDRSPFHLDGTSGSYKFSGWDTQYWIPESGVNAQFDSMYSLITEVLSPMTAVSDISLSPADNMSRAGGKKITASTSTGFGHAGKPNDGRNSPFWVRPVGNAGAGAYGAFTWTAPVSGVATIKINGIAMAEGNGKMPYAVMINGVIVKDWVTFDTTSSSALGDLNAQFATQEFAVCAGDQLSIVVARDSGSATRLDLDLAVTIDTTRVPVVYKKGDTILKSFAVKKGDALPKLTGVSDFGKVGYLVNGVFAKVLPEVVEDGLLIEDYIINSAASITINNRYIINVYVEADADATGAGIIVNGRFMNGTKQADGSYKVAALTIAASQLQKASVTYQTFQTYADGYRISTAEKTVAALDLLLAYSTGNYDATTKALASGVLDFAAALRAFNENKDIGSAGTPSYESKVKNNLKGAPTIADNWLSGKYDIYLGTLKQITTGEVPKYIANFKDATFVPDPTVTEADKVKMGYEEGVDPTASEYKFAIKSVTLNLEDQIGFAFRIVANGSNAISDLRPGGLYALRVDSGVGDYSYYDAFLYEGSDKSAKSIVVEGLPASRYDLDQNFTIVEKQADGSYVEVGATLTYSVKAYAVQTFTFGKADFASYLAQALFRLGVLADEYVAAHV